MPKYQPDPSIFTSRGSHPRIASTKIALEICLSNARPRISLEIRDSFNVVMLYILSIISRETLEIKSGEGSRLFWYIINAKKKDFYLVFIRPALHEEERRITFSTIVNAILSNSFLINTL